MSSRRVSPVMMLLNVVGTYCSKSVTLGLVEDTNVYKAGPFLQLV